MNHDYLSAASKEMSQKTFCSNESDIEPLDLTIKRSEAKNQEEINEKFTSDVDKKHSTGSTITEDKQSNSELPNASYDDSLKFSICKKEFEEHAVLHEGKDVHKCCFCEYRTNRKDNLQRHVKRHGPEPFTCEVCGEMLKERDSHDTEHTCKECETTFQCKTLLLRHSITHTSHCIICWRGMDQHEISEYAIRYYKCCECEYKTEEKTNLHKHFYSHFKEKPFTCVECGKRYKYSSYLRHRNENHPGKITAIVM